MNNKILNKQIPLSSIIKIADYLEEYKKNYDEKFRNEEEKNKDLPYDEKNYEYKFGETRLNYTIEFKNGKNIKESNYDWFIENLSKSSIIKSISIFLNIDFYTKSSNNTTKDVSNKINIDLWFREKECTIELYTVNQEDKAHSLYLQVTNILEDNEDRYNNTIKNRNLRIQSFTLAVGIILSYLIYIILNMNLNVLPSVIVNWLNNKYILILGQWLIAAIAGNVFSYWYMSSLYKPLLPDTRYVGYNTSSNKSIYKDDVNDYTEHSEVQFGIYWDAKKRRERIEKIFNVSLKFVLLQLLISVILFFVL